MKRAALAYVVAAGMLPMFAIAEANAGWYAVDFNAPAGVNRQFTRVYLDGTLTCYLESDANCTGQPFVVPHGHHLVRYEMFSNNGGRARDSGGHIDVWYYWPDAGGSQGNPVPLDVTVPISQVLFDFDKGGNFDTPNGWNVRAWSADKVGALQQATRPSLGGANADRGFLLGTSGFGDVTARVLAGCYTISYESKGSPPSKVWYESEPLCVDGVHDDYEVLVAVP
jgi:hypothetical protein